MNDYSVTFARSARKELEALEIPYVERIVVRIEALMRDPRPRDCKKLQGEENLWRIRIGNYRVVYAICDEKRVVDIIAVRHRRDIYR
ncbi:MAG: type II toxin-antitoxin system RelE/ParE family toxin [Desulfobacterales bacterium]|nr:type II toxin-antitoxin system RelE/ParE family toxin [Desulfobacterales bacterium]